MTNLTIYVYDCAKILVLHKQGDKLFVVELRTVLHGMIMVMTSVVELRTVLQGMIMVMSSRNEDLSHAVHKFLQHQGFKGVLDLDQ